ncbi:hypothetical protein ACIA8K_40160 [Catenuloplanes sp. NPDC051500]
MEQQKSTNERWRQMPERVRPEDQKATKAVGPPPANQVISGDAPAPDPQG